MSMVVPEVDLPEGLRSFRLPEGVRSRLQELLDRQDQGQSLTSAERKEAEGLVDLAEWLSLLGMRERQTTAETIASP